MKTIKLKSFSVVGISVRTTNEHMQAATDILALWNTFFAENIGSKISNKTTEELYCVYTDYETDFTKPYTTILGYKVAHLNAIPEGLTGTTVPEKEYQVFTAKGKLAEGAVYNEWTKIWNTSIDRAYTADFEIYGERSQDPENGEVDIYIALK